MAHGDEIQVLADGPLIRPKAVEPLGIYHGSTCWGLWVHGRSPRNPEQRKNLRAGGNEQLPHLLISPIHPDSWPICFHLEMLLRSTPRAITDVLQIIAGNKVDLHFTEFCQAGYQHALLTTLGEVENLKQWNSAAKLNQWFKQDSGIAHMEDMAPREFGEPGKTIWEGGFTGKKWPPVADVTDKDENARIWLVKALGRRALAEVTKLWFALRRDEYARFKRAMTKDRGSRASNLDPDGDYYFPSRVIQLGRNPFFLRLSDPSAYDLSNHLKPTGGSINNQEYEKAYEFYFGTTLSAEELMALEDLHDSVKATENVAPEVPKGATVEALLARNRTAKQWAVDVLSRIFEAHWRKPITCRTMPPLLHARIFAIDRPTIEFSYDAERGQFRAKDPDALHEALDEFWYTTERARKQAQGSTGLQIPKHTAPKIAQAFIDDRDRCIRLNFLNRRISNERLIEAVILFTARRETLGIELERNLSTRGLMLAVSRAATESKLTILRMTNRIDRRRPGPHSRAAIRGAMPISDFDPTVESGAVKIVAILPEGQSNDQAALRSIATTFRRSWKELSELDAKDGHGLRAEKIEVKLSPTVYALRFDRLFFSTVHQYERSDEVLQIVKHVAAQFGFELVHVKQNLDPVTASVNSRLEICQACLQLATLRDEDRRNFDLLGATFQPQFVWLHHEYAVAKTLRIPVVRMIDTLMPAPFRRQFESVNMEIPRVEFAMNSSAKAIEQAVVLALGQLRQEISQSPRRTDFGKPRKPRR
jgi:hypothetical protein